MEILGYKSTERDRAICYVQDGTLVFHMRPCAVGTSHAAFSPDAMSDLIERWQCTPHLLGGDGREFGSREPHAQNGFRLDGTQLMALSAGHAPYLAVPQELAHIACSVALSPIADVQACYVLHWSERAFGFYRVGEKFSVEKFDVVPESSEGRGHELIDESVDRVQSLVAECVRERLPLLIAGECAARVDWNTRWKQSALFESVFPTPIADDSAIAIGAAVVAQYLELKKVKLTWDMYAGEEFVIDAPELTASGFTRLPFNAFQLSEWLIRWEAVVAWIQGRQEGSSHALGHRSLLAAPFVGRAREAINRANAQHEAFSVSALCLDQELPRRFADVDSAPLALFCYRVAARELEAVSYERRARVHSMNRTHDRRTTELLEAFRAKSGFGVLAQSQLQSARSVGINRLSELTTFVRANGIGVVVIDGAMYVDKNKFPELA
jgi:carbamoyltransferase-like protein